MAAIKTSPRPSEPSSASSPESSMQFPTQKRKGGRKPVYATQEERKMRNRAAQAAFRERRTEYIKHLELTIKHHEEQLSSLQQSSRNAAEEVLMLRYKTSLLERILLEKGIDVQSELRAFSQGEPSTPSASISPISIPQQQQQQRQPHHNIRQQQISRQSISNAPKRGSVSQQSTEAIYIKTSPTMQPTPVSRAPSPHANTSAMPTPPDATTASYVSHSVVSTPTADFVSPGGGNNSGCMSIPHNYYPSPYHQHMEELEQEYQAELLENGNTSPISLDSAPHQQPHHAHPSGNMNGKGPQIGMEHHLAVNLQNGTPPTTGVGVGVGQYNVGIPLEHIKQYLYTNLEDLTEISSLPQYNLPFTFATSNLR